MPILAGDPRIRRSGIGGSDIAKIAGVSKFGTAWDCYLEKTGQAAPLLETERMYWGTTLEDVVAREYAKRQKVKVRQAPTTLDPVTGLRARVVRQSAEIPWRFANVDRLVSGTPEQRGLECKTADVFASSEFGEEDSDQVPKDYLLQCMWYLGVTGYQRWDLAVLIGGNRFGMYRIERDEELIAMLRTVADDFWLNHVVPRIPPEIDGSQGAREYLEAHHRDAAKEIPMTDRLYELAVTYATVTHEIKAAEERKDALGNAIREQMLEAGRSKRDNASVAWTVVKSRRLDTAALAEQHPDLVAPFYRESESPRLTVTVKELS